MISMSWENYLPPSLQLSDIYWTMGACFAVRMMCASIPDKVRTPWLMQLICLVVGVAAALLIFPNTVARVYAIATGMMGAAFTAQFYDLFFSVLEKKVRGWLGIPTPTVPSEPLQLPPQP